MSKLGAALWSVGSSDKAVSFLALARVGSLKSVIEAIDENPEAVTWRSTIDGETAFLAAADWNKYDFMDVLLARGSDVNARYKNEDTALIAAVRKMGEKPKEGPANTALVEYLIMHDADIRLPDKAGKTAAMIALDHGLEGIAQFIEETAERRQRELEQGFHKGMDATVAVKKPLLLKR